eukprot:scaffold814_cov200-Pinguiococcus_pyrenoidosus.AAC.1
MALGAKALAEATRARTATVRNILRKSGGGVDENVRENVFCGRGLSRTRRITSSEFQPLDPFNIRMSVEQAISRCISHAQAA